MKSLAESAGIDVWRCEFCNMKVRKDRPQEWQAGLDGMRAHVICVASYLRRERAADRREYREWLAWQKKTAEEEF